MVEGENLIGDEEVLVDRGQLERLHDDRKAGLALLRRAVELGVDHIDTAQFYGDGFVNDLIREAIRPQDQVVVVSKVGADPDPGGPLPLRLASGLERGSDRPDARAVEAAQSSRAVLLLHRPHAPGDERLEVVGREAQHQPTLCSFSRPHVSRRLVVRDCRRVIPDG